MRVVPGFDKLEDGHSGLGLSLEAAPVKELTLQGGKETLTEGVVETVSDRSGRRPHIGLLASLPESDRGVLASLIGMMDHRGGAALPQGHIQCFQHQFCPKMRLHRPSYNPAGKSIHHHGQIEETCPCRDVRDVRYPQAVGCLARKFRFTRSGITCASLPRMVVRVPFRRLIPCNPAARIRRATRFLPIRNPSLVNSKWIRASRRSAGNGCESPVSAL